MNTLSWMIYAAGIVDGLGNAASFLCFASVMTLMVCGAGKGISGAIAAADDDEGAAKVSAMFSFPVKASLAVLLISGTVNVLTPSAKTIYLIAASEAGVSVATSPDAIEMMGDLKAIIKKRLKEELAE